MSYFAISGVINFLTSIILAFFVYRKNRWQNEMSKIFTFFALSVCLWSFNYFLWQTSTNYDRALLFLRLLMLAAIWIPCVFFHFIIILVGKSKRLHRLQYFNYVMGFVFSILNFTPLFIKDLAPNLGFPYWPNPGGAFLMFLVYFLGLTILAHYLMWNGIRTSKDTKKRLQIKYVFIGTAIGYIGGSTNYFLWYDIPVKPYANILVSIYVGTVAYAIVKHQLLDIEIVIRRAAVFAGLFAFVYGVFSVFTILGKTYFEAVLGWNAWVAMIPIVCVITFALRPLENVLTNVTEKHLFQKPYDYKELIKMFTTEVLTILNLQELPRRTMEGLNSIIKLEAAAIALLNHDTGKYDVRASFGLKGDAPTFTADDPLVYYLNMSHKYIRKGTDIRKMDGGEGQISDDFKKLNAELCLPMIFHQKLIGFIGLGRKKSGEEYNEADIDVLMSLAATEAIAISNAELFAELSQTQAEAAQREKMAVVGTLAAGINHEICNPLGIVRGQCEMFLLNYRDGVYKDKPDKEVVEQATVIMNKVIKETDRATAITKRLSSFAKPSKNFLRDEVTIVDEVEEVLAILGQDLKLGNIRVEANFPPNLPHIYADRKQLQEILFNIIRNGAQAITKDSGRISLRGRANGDRVMIEITDTGGGIPEEKVGQIFNPFFTTKAPGKGTGLGLFIVKQIIERNKGTISVESELGTGTTFALSFEAVPRAAVKV